jgi:ABC-type Zn uptake system ZnuABC Zn-binding protein ZnuA
MRDGLAAVAHLKAIEQAPGGEVSPNDLVSAIEAIKTHRLSVIYAEPQYPSRITEAIREETGVRVMTLDDLGGPSLAGYDSYQAMLSSNIKTLVRGQSIQQ